jgi:cytidyltransferase-like protein
VKILTISRGKLKGLAVTHAKRSPAIPDVPTLAEAGVKDAESKPRWFGYISVPSVDKARQAVIKAGGRVLAAPQKMPKRGEQAVFADPEGVQPDLVGVFDLLHVGHLRYLVEAKRLGDALLVGVNSGAIEDCPFHCPKIERVAPFVR